MSNGTEEIKPETPKEVLPKEVKDYYDKGLAALKRENFDYAVELFSSALALKQDFADARFYLWLSLREQQKRSADPLKIKTFFRKIAGLYLRLQGISLQKSGRMWEAIYQLEKAMKADPGSIATLNAIANCFLSEGQTLNALKILEAVPQINNRNVKTLKRLGNLYMKLENYEKARAYYQAALKVNPYDMEAERGVKDLDALRTLKGSFSTQEQNRKS